MSNQLSKQSLSITVPKSSGEKTIRTASSLGIIDKTLEINRNSESLHIPIQREPNKEELKAIRRTAPDLQISTHYFTHRRVTLQTPAEYLKDRLQPNLLVDIPRSLDIIGDIAIVEIPPELEQYKNLIGKATLAAHKNVRTVFAKAGPISGEFRTREFELIAGKNKTTTTHRENGCQYYMDIAKAYFSPRLSNEHKRIASLTAEEETVIDLFAGIGPFAILIAKTHQDINVHAVDSNPDAVTFLKKNARLNRVENKVHPLLGDAENIVKHRLTGIADRVIMNLPEKAIEFVEPACNALKPEGGIIHFYCFISDQNPLEKNTSDFTESVKNAGRKIRETSAKLVRSTAPHQWQAALDAQIR